LMKCTPLAPEINDRDLNMTLSSGERVSEQCINVSEPIMAQYSSQLVSNIDFSNTRRHFSYRSLELGLYPIEMSN
jgi:hypothetical protein